MPLPAHGEGAAGRAARRESPLAGGGPEDHVLGQLVSRVGGAATGADRRRAALGSAGLAARRAQKLAAPAPRAPRRWRSRWRSPAPPGRAGSRHSRDAPRARARRVTRSALESASTRGSAREALVVGGELALDRRVVRERVGALAAGELGRDVEHVHEQPRALDVREEVVARARRPRWRPRSGRGCRRPRAGAPRPRARRAPARAS